MAPMCYDTVMIGVGCRGPQAKELPGLHKYTTDTRFQQVILSARKPRRRCLRHTRNKRGTRLRPSWLVAPPHTDSSPAAKHAAAKGKTYTVKDIVKAPLKTLLLKCRGGALLSNDQLLLEALSLLPFRDGW